MMKTIATYSKPIFYWCLSILALFFAEVTSANAQSSPGGVAKENLILWLDASTISNAIDAQQVASWPDVSGNGNNASQPSSSKQPKYRTNIINGLPTVSFLEVNETELTGSLIGSGRLSAPLTVITLVKFDASDQLATNNDYVITLGSEGPVGASNAGKHGTIARRKNADGDKDKYYAYDGNQTVIPANADLDDNTKWYIIVQILREDDSSEHYHSAYILGSEVVFNMSGSYANDYAGPFDSDGTFTLGNWSLSDDFMDDFYLNGDIAEIAIFNKELNTSELNIIHSYLAGKWNETDATPEIDLSSGDTYTDLYDGDTNTNGDFDFEIIGIGQTSSADKHSSSSAGGIIISISTGYGNGDYLLVGHDNTQNAINTTDISDNDVSEDLEARWERYWYFDLQDADGSGRTTIKFDLSESGLGGYISGNSTNYKILYSSTGTGPWELLSHPPSYEGDILTFTAVDLSPYGDGYFTLGTTDLTASPIGLEAVTLTEDGPGGIESTNGLSDLQLWLDPNQIDLENGSAVTSWFDNSGYGANLVQTNGSSKPEINYSSDINSVGWLSFDGTDDYLTGNLNSNLAAPATVIVVGLFGRENQGSGTFDNDYMVSIGDTDNNDFEHIGIARRRNESSNINKYYSWRGTSTSIGPVLNWQEWKFITATHNTSSQRHNVYFDGIIQAVPTPDYSTSFSAPQSDINIGRWIGGNNYLLGNIAEVIVYSEVLNTPQLNIIHSYLAAKYGIGFTVSNGDKYIGDCSNSDTSSDCTALAVKPNFDYEVAGIGQDSGETHSSASSGGLNATIVNNFTDGDYLMFGHNLYDNAAIGHDVDVSSGFIESRSERVWFFDVTETDANKMVIDLIFDITEAGLSAFPNGTASNYKLIYRSGLSGDWEIIASATSYDKDQILFDDIDVIDQDGFYSIGTQSETDSPLPITLISFDAKFIESSVKLTWTTLDENENDYFIIEKSKNGIDFEEVSYQKGAGSSESVNRYQSLDHQPYQGKSYYRLASISLTGIKDYSPLVAVESPIGESTLQIKAYPNPVSDILHVAGLENDSLKYYQLISSDGREVHGEELSEANEPFSLDLKQLSQGVYYLRLYTNHSNHTLKILKR